MRHKSFLCKLGARYVREYLSLVPQKMSAKTPLFFPRLIDIKLTFRCNLRCRQCEEWKVADRWPELPVETWIDMLRDIRSTVGPCYVRFYGGEPLVYPGIFELLSYCARHDIVTFLTTNGTACTAEMIRQIIATDVALVNVSIDGSQADTHDFLRGVPGAHGRALAFLDALRGKTALQINTTIMEHNMGEVSSLADFAKQKNIPISYQAVISHTAESDCKGLSPESALFPKDRDRMHEVIDDLLRKKERGYPIVNSSRQLVRFKQYFSGMLDAQVAGCEGIGNHARILPNGRLSLCPWRLSIDSLAEKPLREIWRSPRMTEKIDEMRSCKKTFCRIMRGGHKETLPEKLKKLAQVHGLTRLA